MALIYADRVRETTNTYGTTDTIVLSGADTGYQRFSSVMAIGDTCYFAMVNPNGDWECGRGTLTTADTLVRSNPPQASSNDDINVDWPAGHTSTIFLTMTAASFEEIRCKQALVTLSQNASTAVTGTAILGVYEPSGVDGTNQCATMTTNTLPSGYAASASNTQYANVDAYRAFNKTFFGASQYLRLYATNYPTPGGPGYVQYVFPSTRLITQILAYVCMGGSGYADITVRDFYIRVWGSVDGATDYVKIFDSGMAVRIPEGGAATVAPAVYAINIPEDKIAAYRGYRFEMQHANATISDAPELYELVMNEVSTVQTLTPGIDYRVAKYSSSGIQSLLVTRLKAGTDVLHAIDYV